MNTEELKVLQKKLYSKQKNYTFEEIYPYFKEMFGVGDEYKDDLNILFMLADRTKIYQRGTDQNGLLEEKEFERLIEKIPQGIENKDEMFARLFFKLIDDQSYNNSNVSKTEFTKFFNLIRSFKPESSNYIQSSAWEDYLKYFNGAVIDEIYKIITNGDESNMNQEQFVKWYLSFH